MSDEVKRFNLALSTSLYEQIEKYAQENQITVTEAIRRFLSIGLFAEENTLYKKTEAGEYLQLFFI